jgi:hypothetical protein
MTRSSEDSARSGAATTTLLMLAVSSLALGGCFTFEQTSTAPGPAQDTTEFCAPLGPHLHNVCEGALAGSAAYFAANQRKSCRGLPVRAERDCLLDMTECSEASLRACDASSRTFVCSSPESCPGGLLCDLDVGECQECLGTTDCESGSSCDQGLCIPTSRVLPI